MALGAPRSPVIQARRLLLVIPLTALSQMARQPARACTRGSAKRMAGTPPPRRVGGGVRDPLDDWIREDAAALAGDHSVHQPGVACTRFGHARGQCQRM